MTALDNDFIEDLERPRGGTFVKYDDFKDKGQRIAGTLRNIEIRDRTNPDDGSVVLGRKSGKPRKVYQVTFEVPDDERRDEDDNGLRIWEANEAGQTAIRDAVKAAGTKELIGGKFTARVKAPAPDKFSQATYEAKFEPAPKTLPAELDNDDEEPW